MKIKNIAFDLGGVVLALDYEQALRRFGQIGLDNARQHLDAFIQKGIFGDLEKGLINEEEFRLELGRIIGHEVTMEQCTWAWHGYIKYVPQHNLDCITGLRKQGYKVCLLSNTNPFMMRWARGDFDGAGHSIEHYFDHLYLSYEVKAMKPGPEIFEMMLKGQQATASETLFVDDSPHNCAAAERMGIRTLCPRDNADWRSPLHQLLAAS